MPGAMQTHFPDAGFDQNSFINSSDEILFHRFPIPVEYVRDRFTETCLQSLLFTLGYRTADDITTKADHASGQPHFVFLENQVANIESFDFIDRPLTQCRKHMPFQNMISLFKVEKCNGVQIFLQLSTTHKLLLICTI